MTRTAPTVAPAPTGPAPGASMRDRVPAQALLEQVLLRQAVARRRGRLERLIGVDPVDPEARGWYTGAIGERLVAARLAGLPDGWTVLHSLPLGRGGADIDHLVVGPGGVFTISTKLHVDASVWVAGRSVLVAGRRQAYTGRSASEARRVDRIVAGVVPDAPAVQPVVAVVGAKRLTVKAGPSAVTVLRAEQLRRWLRSRPVRLAPEQVARLVARFDDAATWQPTVEAGPELLLAFNRLHREVRAAARTRVGWALALAVLAVGGAAAMVLPGLLAMVPGR